MNTFRKISACVYAAFCLLSIESKTQAQDIQSLIKAENDFCRSALDDGIKPAFLKVLTDSSISFRPLPVVGKKHLQQEDPDKGTLFWKPDLSMVSSGGDWGYTSGPYEYRRHGEQSEIVAYGHYLSVWKNINGRWKLFADIGAPHEKCNDFTVQAEILEPKRYKHKKTTPTQHLLDFDKEFSGKCSEGKPGKHFKKVTVKNTRILTGGQLPLEGKEKLDEYIQLFSGQPINATPLSAFASATGDFGFTYGTLDMQTTKGEKGKAGYVRVWKRKSHRKWLLVAQATSTVVKD